jgi:hypothetical protein
MLTAPPDVTHSRNIAVRPEVGIVVFDSHAANWILAKDGEPDHRIPVQVA